jgi:sporulation protein YqfC
MKRNRQILRRIAIGTDLPEEYLTAQPILELCGKNRLLIEHHGGVTEYGRERICVKVSFGEYCITGIGLSLCRMQGQQLLIRGTIFSVELKELVHS